MALKKLLDISNETDSRYTRFKQANVKSIIEERFDTGSFNDNPFDDAIQFIKEKLDEVIEVNNDKIVGRPPVYTDTTQTITGNKFFGTTTKLHFRDSGIYLNSNTDGTLQIVSDNKVNIFGKVKIMNSALTASGAISASGDITANAFIGDGSSLTSLPSQTDNNFTTTLKNKLDGISAGADVTPSWVPSTNPNYLTSVNASDVGLGNVTNESKATMFTNAALTGNPTAPTQTANDDSTKIATTAYVQQELTDLIGTAPAALDTLGELSASLAADQTGLASLTTTVGTKLAKSSNLSDLTNAETARTNLGLGSAATSDTGDFAAASHTHAASDITSGTFTTARIPSLATSKITTGTFANARISEGSVTQHEGALTITEAQISDLGTYSTATGVEDNANNYSLPAAASNTRGGVKIGYSENGKNYPVELSSEQMFVNVPWTDTNTTYTVGDGGLTQNNFTDALKTKLDGISTSADVTDATTVAAAGALMDSEVTNLAQVKAFDSSDYATAAQGTKADTAHGWGNHASAGYSTATGVENNADVTDTTNVTAAGALMDSELTDLAGIKSLNTSTLQVKPSEGAFANGDKTKLDGIATGADVTPTWVPSVDPRYLTRIDLTRDVTSTLPIANGGTGATTAGAALTALGAAASSHTHAASDITSGTLAEARIPDDMDSGKVKQICTTHHNFFMNSTSTTVDFFVPFNNLNESSNPTNAQYYNRMVAPYDGRIVKVVLHTTAAIGTSCQVLFWVATSSGVFAPSAAETVTGVNLNTANSSATATFSTTSTAQFSAEDVLGVSIIKSDAATANMQVTVVWEYTL
jgi:hypothetical protein